MSYASNVFGGDKYIENNEMCCRFMDNKGI